MTRRRVQTLTGISESCLFRFEMGITIPTAFQLLEIASALEVEVKELYPSRNFQCINEEPTFEPFLQEATA
jgi:hypothetical protein